MKIKVSPFSKKVWRQYTGIVAVLSAFAAFYLVSVEVPDKKRWNYTILATSVLLIIYFIIWIRANLRQRTKLTINNSSLVIKVGDIFEEKELKVIGFNEYFDTQVDDVLISKSSLHGQYLLNLGASGVKVLDQHIASDSRLKERRVQTNANRRMGKKIQYKLGSIFVDKEYLLVAFSRFNDQNQAVLTLKEYVASMLNFWDEVDQVYAGRSVALPLMGSGITRLKDAEVQPQELLNILIWTFKISRVKFKHPASATVVIHESMQDKINLFEVES